MEDLIGSNQKIIGKPHYEIWDKERNDQQNSSEKNPPEPLPSDNVQDFDFIVFEDVFFVDEHKGQEELPTNAEHVTQERIGRT